MSNTTDFNKVCFLFVAALFATQQIGLSFVNDVPLILFIPFLLVMFSFVFSPMDVDLVYRPWLFFILVLSTTSVMYCLIWKVDGISFYSYLYLLVIYSIFFFRVSIPKFFDYYVLIVVVVALLGITQFLLQKIGLSFYHFASVLPDELTIKGFNITYETYYSSGFFKPNGYFCLEPSYYSQFIALAMIIELMTYRRYALLCLFAVAIFTSFSGTGFLLLLLFFINTIVVEMRVRFFVVMGVMALIGVPLALYLFPNELSFIISRLSEFESSESSANVRFIAPYISFFEYVNHFNVAEFFFGSGPGSVDEIKFTNGVVNYPSTVKSFIEYGVPFFLSYVLFVIHLVKNEVPRYLFLPLLGFVFVTSGSLLQPSVVMFLWFCCSSSKINYHQNMENF